ncbi:MAG: TIGR02452 family protein [Clostridia bacterium]|nr:TIGR02452 family protein [Clostridia bacterium]
MAGYSNNRRDDPRRERNRQILENTLETAERGRYIAGGRMIGLPYNRTQIRTAITYVGGTLDALRQDMQLNGPARDISSIRFSCENTDTLALTWKRYRECLAEGEKAPKVLVQNLASAVHPGGGVRNGATAQEEDLCRKTSLLLSLESNAAKPFYDYNWSLNSKLGSDAVIISPCVEVMKDSGCSLLAEPYPIGVITCAAPNIRNGLEGRTQAQYRELLRRRIMTILCCAAENGYRHLVLGAFGCGVFGNDAALVSNLFMDCIRSFSYKGSTAAGSFETIDFAVLCKPDNDYNYREFARNFAGAK